MSIFDPTIIWAWDTQYMNGELSLEYRPPRSGGRPSYVVRDRARGWNVAWFHLDGKDADAAETIAEALLDLCRLRWQQHVIEKGETNEHQL